MRMSAMEIAIPNVLQSLRRNLPTILRTPGPWPSGLYQGDIDCGCYTIHLQHRSTNESTNVKEYGKRLESAQSGSKPPGGRQIGKTKHMEHICNCIYVQHGQRNSTIIIGLNWFVVLTNNHTKNTRLSLIGETITKVFGRKESMDQVHCVQTNSVCWISKVNGLVYV